ncbi:MAG: putative porin [Sphingomonadaceae bacterium]
MNTMFRTPRRRGARAGLVGAAIAVALSWASIATAQEGTAPVAVPPAVAGGGTSAAAPSLDMTTNLVRLMVKRGLITEAEAQDLFAQAEAATRAAQQAARTAPPPAEGVQRVPYVSPSVRAAIRDEIKQDVLAQAQREGWAEPGLVEDWLRGLKIGGDFRMRSRSDFLDSGNFAGAILDVANFNGTGPFDINPATNPTAFPTINSTRNRPNRLLLRARLGVEAKVSDELLVGIRLASGNSNSPVSTNNLLGDSFTKKGIWLDQAYVDFHPTEQASLVLGRMPPPFDTTDLIFDADLNFEGIAFRAQTALFDDTLEISATGGGFPLEFTPSNFPANLDNKAADRNKWLFAGQLSATFRPTSDVKLRLSGAYFSYDNVQGQLSTPCATYLLARQCSSDASRPAFSQKGNTVFPLRLIAQNPADPNAVITPFPQFLGLAMDYDQIYVKGDVTVDLGKRYSAKFKGDFVRNLSYRPQDACRFGPAGAPFTNVVPSTLQPGQPLANICQVAATNGTTPQLFSGDTGWRVSMSFGSREILAWGDFLVMAGYRYLEGDAVLDGLTDSNFGLGGTNARGYFVQGTLGLAKGINVDARYLASREVSGLPFAVDTVFVDLNFGF